MHSLAGWVLGFWCGLGNAHYPHDVAAWVAIAPGEHPEWVVTSLWRTEAWMLVRLQDDQVTDVRYAMNGHHYLTSAAFSSDEALFLGSDGSGMWASADAGLTLYQHTDFAADAVIHQVVADPRVVETGLLVAAGEGAIWRSVDGGQRWQVVYAPPGAVFIDVDLSPQLATDGRICAVSDDGAVHCSDDSGASFAVVGAVGGAPWSISVGQGTRIFVGDATGLWRSQDDGARWTRVGFESEHVTVVEEVDDDVVLAATLRTAVWRSADGGDTWDLASDDLEVAQPGQGGPREEEHYFEIRAAGDGGIYLGSWEGLARSDDQGLTWTRVHTEHQSVVRSVDLTLDERGEPIALLATYGGGVVKVLPEPDVPRGESISTAVGLRYLRAVAATPYWGRDGFAAFAGAGDVYMTSDGAQSWVLRASGEVGGIQKIDTAPNYDSDPVVQIGGSVGSSVAVARSVDGGQTWTRGDIGTCDGETSALFHSWAWEVDLMAWVACADDGTIFQSADGGLTWSLRGSVGQPVFAVVGAPGGALVFAGALDGLYEDVGAGFVRTRFEDDQVQALAISPNWAEDPTVFALLARGGWWRSEDGGASWTQLTAPDDSYPLSVALSPSFDQDGMVAASGYGGAWISRDRGDTWAWLNVVERHEEDSPHWSYQGAWIVDTHTDASGGRVYGQSSEGDRATIRFEGVRADLFAAASGAGEAAVRIRLDAGEPVSVTLSDTPGQVIWISDVLEDAWHTLELEVEEGSVALDAVQIWRQTGAWAPLDTGTDSGDSGSDSAPPETGDSGAPLDPASNLRCDCRGGSPAALLLIPLLLRRRRRVAPTP